MGEDCRCPQRFNPQPLALEETGCGGEAEWLGMVMWWDEKQFLAGGLKRRWMGVRKCCCLSSSLWLGAVQWSCWRAGGAFLKAGGGCGRRVVKGEMENGSELQCGLVIPAVHKESWSYLSTVGEVLAFFRSAHWLLSSSHPEKHGFQHCTAWSEKYPTTPAYLRYRSAKVVKVVTLSYSFFAHL